MVESAPDTDHRVHAPYSPELVTTPNGFLVSDFDEVRFHVHFSVPGDGSESSRNTVSKWIRENLLWNQPRYAEPQESLPGLLEIQGSKVILIGASAIPLSIKSRVPVFLGDCICCVSWARFVYSARPLSNVPGWFISPGYLWFAIRHICAMKWNSGIYQAIYIIAFKSS